MKKLIASIAVLIVMACSPAAFGQYGNCQIEENGRVSRQLEMRSVYMQGDYEAAGMNRLRIARNIHLDMQNSTVNRDCKYQELIQYMPNYRRMAGFQDVDRLMYEFYAQRVDSDTVMLNQRLAQSNGQATPEIQHLQGQLALDQQALQVWAQS